MQIEVISEQRAADLRLENWIGTLGRGKSNLDARNVKTQKQAEAWIRRVSSGGYRVKTGAYVWLETGVNPDGSRKVLGWAAWVS